MSSYSLSKAAYVFKYQDQEHVGFFMGSEHDKQQAQFEILSMLKHLPDLSKPDTLEDSIQRFEAWQVNPELPKGKKKK